MDTENPAPSRRLVMGGLATRVAAALGSTAARADAAAVEPPANSVTEYPRPPFHKQQQDWPGQPAELAPI